MGNQGYCELRPIGGSGSYLSDSFLVRRMINIGRSSLVRRAAL